MLNDAADDRDRRGDDFGFYVSAMFTDTHTAHDLAAKLPGLPK
jgi:hypothetical protein